MKHPSLWRVVCAALVCLASTLPIAAAPLTFTDGGEIVGAGGRISIGSGGFITIATATGDKYVLNLPIGVRGGKTHWTAGDLDDRKVTVSAPSKTATFTATLSDKVLATPIPLSLSTTLTADGKARITLRFETTEPIDKFLSMQGVCIYINREPIVGSQVSVNGTTARIDAGQLSATLLTNIPNQRDVIFFSDDPYRTLALHVVKAQGFHLDENLREIGIRSGTAENQLIFDVDLPEKVKPVSPETYAGFDFYDAEHMHMPQYGLSRNLVQNPGFEQGLQYWMFGNLGSDKGNRFPDNYVLDTTQASSGRKCVKILVEKGERPSPLASFAIPVESGSEYTLSFYAKGERAGLAVGTTVFGGGDAGWSPNWKTLAIGTDWKRYSYSFKAPRSAISVQFGAGGFGFDSAVYLDDIQLEKGQLTDFTRKPLEMAFVTDRRDNLFKPGDTVHGRWEMTGSAGMGGKLLVALRDFQSRTVKEQSAAFKIAADGTASVALPWLERTERGGYTLEATATLADGSKFREDGRLSIMPPADPTTKHHTLLAAGYFSTQFGSWDRIASGLEYFGIGSAINFDPLPHAALAVLAKHHIVNVSQIYYGSDHVGKIELKDGFTGTDADLPLLEEDAYQKAKEYPEIMYWKTVNEPGGDLVANVESTKRWVRALGATYRGIKRANPKAQVFTIDPANMSPNNGIALVDNFLANGGGAISDLAAIHPYRGVPEGMDADLATFQAMLDRHKFTGDIWFTEGGDMCDVHVPGMVTGADNWRINHFAYDMGDGERRTAAFQMRLWLVGFKYANRVKQQVDWSFDAGNMDYDGTPTLRAFAVNTLSEMLGNADFVKEIPLGPNEVCYVFKDAKQRPVAVVWNADTLSHGVKPLPQATLHLASLAKSLQLVNMVGTTVLAEKNGDLKVSPFPVFLRGEPGTLDKLTSAIEKGFEASAVGSVVGYVIVKDAGHIGVELRNTTAKAIQGSVVVTTAPQPTRPISVDVAPGKTAEVLVSYTTPVMGIQSADMAIKWTPTGSSDTQTFPARVDSLLCPKLTSPLAVDGNISAWKAAGANMVAIPPHMMSYKAYPPNPKYPDKIPWTGPKDLSATMAIGYSTGMLYVGFDITDDVFAPASTAPTAWQGDGIQLYFDPWQNGHSLVKSGFLDEDQELDLWPGGASPTVYRAVKPAFQVAFTKLGIVPAIKSSVTKRDGGYVVQMAIPEAELAPLSLKPGSVFGFSFIINDSDGDFRKRGLTLTPEGTEPFNRPDLFPSIVLGS